MNSARPRTSSGTMVPRASLCSWITSSSFPPSSASSSSKWSRLLNTIFVGFSSRSKIAVKSQSFACNHLNTSFSWSGSPGFFCLSCNYGFGGKRRKKAKDPYAGFQPKEREKKKTSFMNDFCPLYMGGLNVPQILKA